MRKPLMAEETAQLISMHSNTSEKSVSEGFMVKNIPDSKIPNNKNKFNYDSLKYKKSYNRARDPSDPCY